MSRPTSLAHRLAVVALTALLPIALVSCDDGGGPAKVTHAFGRQHPLGHGT